MEILLSSVWLALITWLMARAIRQRHALAPLAPNSSPAADCTGSVVVIIPARDEGHNIRGCVESLMAQQYAWANLHVVVVDDGSLDDTAEIVEALAADAGDRITLLRAPELPSGWKGKTHACWVGSESAAGQPDWLCFLDADMRAQPLLIRSAVEAASRNHIDLLSLAPRHELLSVAERLILPCGMYLLGFSQDLHRVQASGTDEVVATGQFLLARRTAYEEIGGHSEVRTCICEDLELARRFKQRGYKVLLQDGTRLLRTRMYTGWRTLWPGIAKNLTETLGGPLRTLLVAAAAIILAWSSVILPLVQGIECHRGASQACVALVPALLGSAAVFALHIAGAIHFAIPIWYGLIFPLGYTAGALIALDSVRWRVRGRVLWKGRIYE